MCHGYIAVLPAVLHFCTALQYLNRTNNTNGASSEILLGLLSLLGLLGPLGLLGRLGLLGLPSPVIYLHRAPVNAVWLKHRVMQFPSDLSRIPGYATSPVMQHGISRMSGFFDPLEART